MTDLVQSLHNTNYARFGAVLPGQFTAKSPLAGISNLHTLGPDIGVLFQKSETRIMTTNILRYVSVGLTVASAGVAWGDTMYMYSGRDGGVYFSNAPATPRFSTPTVSERTSRFANREISPLGRSATNLSEKSKYASLVDEVAQSYQLESALLHAVISVESRYNPKALSPTGAAGLMQLMPATAKRYGVDNAFDPEQNLRAGAKYLRDLLSMFGSDIQLALAAYHAGEYSVAKHQNRIPPFQATIDFVSRVLDYYHKYRGNSAY